MVKQRVVASRAGLGILLAAFVPTTRVISKVYYNLRREFWRAHNRIISSMDSLYDSHIENYRKESDHEWRPKSVLFIIQESMGLIFPCP